MKEILIERLQCSEKRAAMIAGDLEKLSPELIPLLNKWLSSGECRDDTSYHGYSLDRIMNEYGMKFTGALLTLDWILKDSQCALTALAEPIR